MADKRYSVDDILDEYSKPVSKPDGPKKSADELLLDLGLKNEPDTAKTPAENAVPEEVNCWMDGSRQDRIIPTRRGTQVARIAIQSMPYPLENPRMQIGTKGSTRMLTSA